MSNSEKIHKILKEHFNTDAITPTTHLVDDLGADSLDIVEVIMQVEEECDIEIPDEDTEGLHSVGDIVFYVENNS